MTNSLTVTELARLGGLARMAQMTPEKRQAMARKGGRAQTKAQRQEAARKGWLKRKGAQ